MKPASPPPSTRCRWNKVPGVSLVMSPPCREAGSHPEPRDRLSFTTLMWFEKCAAHIRGPTHCVLSCCTKVWCFCCVTWCCICLHLRNFCITKLKKKNGQWKTEALICSTLLTNSVGQCCLCSCVPPLPVGGAADYNIRVPAIAQLPWLKGQFRGQPGSPWYWKQVKVQ